MPAIKHSKQREAIMAFLKTRYDHPTADTVYMNIRQEFPNISLGTVYRNLSLLCLLYTSYAHLVKNKGLLTQPLIFPCVHYYITNPR